MNRRVLALLVTAAVAALVAAPAHAKTTEPPVGEYGWYWEDQQRVKGPDDAFEFTWPNPYCPGTAFGGVSEVCKAGRLPIEVRNGDYETPNKLAAVAFDLTLVTPGSEIEKFEVTFVEANDHQSDTGGFNHERKQLQACTVLEYFGTGEAREYSETPRFRCTKDDPRARHRVVGEGDAQRHEWTFDLTAVAAKWMDKGSIVTAILLRPVDPANERAVGGIKLPDDGLDDKAAADDDAAAPAQGEPHDNWRVVLLGPEERGGAGIQTTLVYDAPALPDPPPPPDTTTPPTTTPSTTSPSFDSGSDFGTTTTDTSTDTSTTTGDAIASSTPEPTPTPTPVEASGEEPVSATGPELPSVEGFPWYMWLALIAGLVGFSMVRSVLLESATGVRPDGVLAQIRKLNAERKGAAAPAAAAGRPARSIAALAAGARLLGSLPRRASGLVGRARKRG